MFTPTAHWFLLESWDKRILNHNDSSDGHQSYDFHDIDDDDDDD